MVRKQQDVKITFKVGTQRFNTTDEIINSLGEAFKIAIDQTTEDIHFWIIANVPIDTGRLQTSLEPTESFIQGRAMININSDVPYARFVDKHKPYLKELRSFLKERTCINVLKGLNSQGLK